MRLENSIRNVTFSLAGQFLSISFSFMTRMVFVRYLPKPYLGIEGLFSSILMVLSLTELGIGGAIVYSLYKPLAEDDKPKITALMQLYRKAYILVGISIAILGTIVSFRLSWFMKEVPDINNLQLIFLCFVFNSAISYFFSYKGSLITADQKNYIVALVQYLFNILMCICQIAILLMFHSYWGFLFAMLASTFAQNIVIAWISNKMYPYQNKKIETNIDTDTMLEIKKNTMALVMHSISGVAATPLTNMILSRFIGLSLVAMYSNYLLFTNVLQRIIVQIFQAIVASAGNLGVTENDEKKEQIFMLSFYINATIAILLSVPLMNVFSHAIRLFFGPSYVLSMEIEILITVLFFTRQLRNAALAFTSALGLYWFTRYKAILESVVLVGLSLILVKPFGLVGILSANIFTCVFISALYEGYMLYKHGFRMQSLGYFIRWAYYLFLAIILGIISLYCASILSVSTENLIMKLILQGSIGVLVALIGIFIGTAWLPESKEFVSIINRIFSLFLRRKAK